MGILFDSFIYDLLLLVFSLVLYVYIKFKSMTTYFIGSGIPTYVPYKSLLENNTFGAYANGSMGEVYDKLYKQMAGFKYGGFYNTMKPCIMIRDPETILKVLTKDFQSFNDHGLTTDEDTNPLEGNLFFLSGPRWKALRRKLSPTFTSGKLKNMFGLIADCADELVGHLQTTTGQDLEMKELLARFTTDVIGSCAFGLEPVSIKNPDSEFRRIANKFFHPSFFTMTKAITRFVIPSFFKTFHIATQPKEIIEFFKSLTSQALEHRMKTGKERNDFVQLLLQLKMKGSVETDDQDLKELESETVTADSPETVKVEFTDSLLAAQAFVFFIAGFETTASAISFSLYLLAKHQKEQDRARKEVKELKEKNGGVLNYDCLKNMAYLEACVSETLRIYPPVQALPRLCTKDYKMEDGYVIKKGMLIFIPIFSLHRDPEYFPEPEVFKPDRYLWDENKHIPGTYLPFGYGPRICIGQRFALIEALMSLAKILDQFRFTLCPKMSEPLKLKSQTFVVVPAEGLWLNFQKLED